VHKKFFIIIDFEGRSSLIKINGRIKRKPIEFGRWMNGGTFRK
jgi:hypothetical protein